MYQFSRNIYLFICLYLGGVAALLLGGQLRGDGDILTELKQGVDGQGLLDGGGAVLLLVLLVLLLLHLHRLQLHLLGGGREEGLVQGGGRGGGVESFEVQFPRFGGLYPLDVYTAGISQVPVPSSKIQQKDQSAVPD